MSDRIQSLIDSNLVLLHQINEFVLANQRTAVAAKQAITALAKYASGIRPGMADWTAEDQAALNIALGEKP